MSGTKETKGQRKKRIEKEKKQALIKLIEGNKIKEEEDSKNVFENDMRELLESVTKLSLGSLFEKGSYGEVFLLEQKRGRKFNWNNAVVCKKVEGYMFDSPEKRRDYIKAELEVSKSLLKHDCANLVKIIDVDFDNCLVFMEFAGYDIEQLINYTGVDLNILRMFLIQMTNAIHFLYKRKLIHRDVSLRNIKMNISNKVISFTLIDVGSCSKNIDGTTGVIRHSRTDEIMTWRTDIYHVGLCAQQLMLKTVSPLKSQEDIQLAIEEEFGELTNLVDNMIQDDPNLRPDHSNILKCLMAPDQGVKNFSHLKLINKVQTQNHNISDVYLKLIKEKEK